MWWGDFADVKQVQEASGLPQPSTRKIPQAEDVSEYILRGFDSFWKDVSDRLTITRTVDYSVIGCVVNAASQEAAELVACREAEVVGLKKDLEELLLEQQVRGEIEKALIGNVLRSLWEEFETKLGDRNVHVRGERRTASRMHKFEELSGLRKHWDAIRKSLSGLEVAQQGTLETDHSHLKSINQVSPTSGQADEFNIGLPESRQSSQLGDMDIDELYHFFRTRLTEMKWDHESAIQATTEENFSLKRDLLNERRSCFPFKKEIDIMRKKIPEAIVELDEILLESLVSENQHLMDLVATKSDEVEHLTSRLSDASKKASQHSLVEAKLNEAIGDLESRVQDTQIEASVSEGVFEGYAMELLLQIGRDVEESNAMSAVAQECMEIIYKETVHHVAAAVKSGDDSDFESIFLQGISGIVLEEVLTGVGMELESLKVKCLQESECVESLKCNALEMERSLAEEAEEISHLRREMAVLEASVEDAVRLAADHASTVREVLDGHKVKLEEWFQKNALYEEEIAVLKERLESVEKERRELVVREKSNLRLAEAKDAEQRKQMESTIHYTQELLEEFDIFEIRALEKLNSNSLRLEKSTGQLNSLNQKACMLRQKLANRVSDRRKVEIEVDLLGDEVDTLSNLLEKIYIALDHYSPILRYYPGRIFLPRTNLQLMSEMSRARISEGLARLWSFSRQSGAVDVVAIIADQLHPTTHDCTVMEILELIRRKLSEKSMKFDMSK